MAEYLGLELTPGMVVDLSSAQYGADSKIAFASAYADHPITRNFMLRTLFPEARKVDAHDSYNLGWQVTKLVDVAPNGWLETGKIDGTPDFDGKTDIRGPINIAVAIGVALSPWRYSSVSVWYCPSCCSSPVSLSGGAAGKHDVHSLIGGVA